MKEHDETIERLKIIEGLQHKILDKLNDGDPEEVLTRKEVSKRYKVSLGTIHNAMNNGDLMYYKKGSRTFYKKAEVDDWFLR